MDTQIKSCPGAAALKGAQKLKIKICPVCGGEIEIFSKDVYAECKCGFVACNDSQNCIKWCAYARKCVGDEIYEKFAGNSTDLASYYEKSINAVQKELQKQKINTTK